MRFFPFAALFSGTAWAAAAAEYGSVYFCRGASLDGECETLEIPSRRCGMFCSRSYTPCNLTAE